MECGIVVRGGDVVKCRIDVAEAAAGGEILIKQRHDSGENW